MATNIVEENLNNTPPTVSPRQVTLEDVVHEQRTQIRAQSEQIHELVGLIRGMTVGSVIPEAFNPPRDLGPVGRNVPNFGRHHAEMIPPFNGDLSMVQPFLEVTEKIYQEFWDLNNPDSFQNFTILSSIKSKILPPAAEVIAAANANTYAQIRQAILDSFQDRRDGNTLELHLATLRHGDSEDPFKFFERVQKLLHALTAYVKTHNTPAESAVLVPHHQKLALRVFLLNLREPLGSALRARNPGTLSEALGIMTNEAQMHPNLRKPSSVNQQKTNFPQKSNNNAPGGFKFQPNPQNKGQYFKAQNSGQQNQRPQNLPQGTRPQTNTPVQSSGNQNQNPKGVTPQNFQSKPNNWVRQTPGQPNRSNSHMSWQTTPNFNNVLDSELSAEIPDSQFYEENPCCQESQDYILEAQDSENPGPEENEIPFLDQTSLQNPPNIN